jgi:hypothetical protein
MRIVCGVLCAILIFFAVLQYNDPDLLFWGAVYLLAAVWCGLAAWRPNLLREAEVLRYGAYASIALFGVGFLALAPTIKSNWIHIETAREAFGYLICAVATILACWTALRQDTDHGRTLATRS